MALLRAVSQKKCRFSAKKITFLEYQRVKRLELTKNITARKRLGSILFLPEADDSNFLTHESVQRILHQGSLFHTVKVRPTNSENRLTFGREINLPVLSNPEQRAGRGSLNDLLYGRIFNVRCLSNHELCLLLSYLAKASEFSGAPNLAVLSKALEQVKLNLHTFSVPEIAHTMYSINEIWRKNSSQSATSGLKANGDRELLELCCNIMNRVASMLLGQGDLAKIDFGSSKNIAKIVFSVSHWPFFQDGGLRAKSAELLGLYAQRLQFDENAPKDFSLVCQAMRALRAPNYELLGTMADFYRNSLLKFNATFKPADQDNSKGHASSLYNVDTADAMVSNDEFVPVQDILVMLETSEHFGVNHKGLLDAFDEYINTYLAAFGNNPHLRELCDSEGNRKVLSLVRDRKCTRSNRLDLQEVASRMPDGRTHLWDGDVTLRIAKYVNRRRPFRRYLERNNITCETPKLGSSGHCTEGAVDLFLKSVEYLPKVVNFNAIWAALHAINREGMLELVPMAYSYLREASTVFEALEGPSADLLGLFDQVATRAEAGEADLVVIDNLTKLVEVVTETDLKRDDISLAVFGNLFAILRRTEEIAAGPHAAMDQCGSMCQLKAALGEYFRRYPEAKELEFAETPTEGWSHTLVPLEDNRRIGEEDMMEVLEGLGRLTGAVREAAERNRDVLRFAIYNGFMAELEKTGHDHTQTP